MLNPFHPVYELTKPNLFAKALVFFKILSLSDLVKASLPKINIGSLAFFIYSHN